MGRAVRFYNDRFAGFTLIEVVITMAIVAILAAIAYPSFIDQVRKVRRADAQTVLMQNAQVLERIYTQTGCYNPGTDMDCQTGTAANFTLPYAKSPVDGSANYYTITYFSDAEDEYFKLKATPVSGGSQDGTGFVTLDSLGRKTWDQNNNDVDTDTHENDWDRD